jgi:phage tail sheath gpL-like
MDVLKWKAAMDAAERILLACHTTLAGLPAIVAAVEADLARVEDGAKATVAEVEAAAAAQPNSPLAAFAAETVRQLQAKRQALAATASKLRSAMTE